MFTNLTWGVLIGAAQLSSVITIPYNAPDPATNPNFILNFASTSEDGATPVRKTLDKDVYDSTFWDSN